MKINVLTNQSLNSFISLKVGLVLGVTFAIIVDTNGLKHQSPLFMNKVNIINSFALQHVKKELLYIQNLSIKYKLKIVMKYEDNKESFNQKNVAKNIYSALSVSHYICVGLKMSPSLLLVNTLLLHQLAAGATRPNGLTMQ